MLKLLRHLGQYVISRWTVIRDIASVSWGLVTLSLRPSSWNRTVREQLSRQVLFTGFEASRLVILMAVLTGISVVVQIQVMLSKIGHSALLGTILVAVVVRELAPLLVNFVIIGRSCTAISTELANMKVNKEVDLLDSQGVEPMIYLMIPRVLGIIISNLCLTILFITACMATGYLFAFLLGVTTSDPTVFARTVFSSILPSDILNILAKTLIPGLATGVIACVEGLKIEGIITEVPQATTRSVVNSIAALLLISVIVSVFTYVR